MSAARKFPKPWRVEAIAGGFVIVDANAFGWPTSTPAKMK